MDVVIFDLPTGETLNVSRDDARVLARRLWASATEPGAAPLAVAINSALSVPGALPRRIDVSEREHRALRRVLATELDP